MKCWNLLYVALLACLAVPCGLAGQARLQDRPERAKAVAAPRKEGIDLTKIVSLAQRLGAERFFDSQEAFLDSAVPNFVRIYRRQVNRALFLSYPPPEAVADRIAAIFQDHLELSRAIYQLHLPCSPLQSARAQGAGSAPGPLDARAAQRLRKASRRLEADFSTMFLEATSSNGKIRPLLEAGRRGDTCAQVEEVIRISGDLRRRLVTYFFAPDAVSVPVQRLNALPIRSLASAIHDAAKEMGRE